jgi:hypothetical protein
LEGSRRRRDERQDATAEGSAPALRRGVRRPRPAVMKPCPDPVMHIFGRRRPAQPGLIRPPLPTGGNMKVSDILRRRGTASSPRPGTLRPRRRLAAGRAGVAPSSSARPTAPCWASSPSATLVRGARQGRAQADPRRRGMTREVITWPPRRRTAGRRLRSCARTASATCPCSRQDPGGHPLRPRRPRRPVQWRRRTLTPARHLAATTWSLRGWHLGNHQVDRPGRPALPGVGGAAPGHGRPSARRRTPLRRVGPPVVERAVQAHRLGYVRASSRAVSRSGEAARPRPRSP